MIGMRKADGVVLVWVGLVCLQVLEPGGTRTTWCSSHEIASKLTKLQPHAPFGSTCLIGQLQADDFPEIRSDRRCVHFPNKRSSFERKRKETRLMSVHAHHVHRGMSTFRALGSDAVFIAVGAQGGGGASCERC